VKWIGYSNAKTVDEAVELLSQGDNKAKVLAGGTDLLVQLRVAPQRINNPDLIVDIKDIPELNEVEFNSESGLTLGAAVPCYQVYQNPVIAQNYPGLIDSASLIGGTQIQGRASIGGNLCNSAPSADAIPILIALSARCNIAGPDGIRQLAVEDFCTGPGSNSLKQGEILISVSFPPPNPKSGARYIRFIPRNEMDIAVVGAGISVTLENNEFKSVRVALAAVAPTPLFVTEVGEALSGKTVNDKNIELAGDIARNAAKPISDMRGTIEYRKHLCSVLTKRALTTAIERANGGTVNGH